MPLISGFAVVSLVLTGLFLIAIHIPPLYNMIFGEEPRLWSPVGVANGVMYLAAATLFGIFRSRLGLGLGLVLAMTGFTQSLSWTLSRFGMGTYFPVGEIVVTSALAILQAVAFVGALSAARRWGVLSEPAPGTALPAALLAGLGFALGLGFGGGEWAIVLHPIERPMWFIAIQYWLPVPHFVAAAALALRGRFADLGALLVCVAGISIALRMLAGLLAFEGGPGSQILQSSVFVWSLFLVAYATAAGLLSLRWIHRFGSRATSP